MLELVFEVSERQQRELLQFASAFRREAAQAAARALNRAGAQALTEAKRIIAAELGIRQGDLVREHRFGAVGSQSTGQALRLTKATPDELRAVVRITGKRIPAIYLHAKPDDPSAFAGFKNRLQRGVSWNLGRGRTRVTSAFVARMPSGHEGVFRRLGGVPRKGGPRKPPQRPERFAGLPDEKFVELKGPSIPLVASKSPEFDRALRIDITATLAQRLDHEIDYALRRITGGH